MHIIHIIYDTKINILFFYFIQIMYTYWPLSNSANAVKKCHFPDKQNWSTYEITLKKRTGK